MIQRIFLITITTLILSLSSSHAQGLYSKSLSVTDLKGVWSNGYATLESDNAIASNKKADYVKSNLHKYRNILMITTEKMEYQDKTYYIWEIDYMMDLNNNKSVQMTDFLVLTETQNNSLKNTSIEDVSILQIPTYSTSAMAKVFRPETIEEGIKTAIVEKNDILSHTYTITARREGEHIFFNYNINIWTHNGDPNKRTYSKLDLEDNIDGGYFKIPAKQWENLFYR